MFCKYCGNELTEDARYCPKCGKITENVEEETEQKEYDFFASATPVTPTVEIKDEERNSLGGEILKFAILGLAFGCTVWLSLVGLIFSYIWKAKLNRYMAIYGKTENKATVGKHIGIAGMIVSWIFTIIGILFVLLEVLMISMI